MPRVGDSITCSVRQTKRMNEGSVPQRRYHPSRKEGGPNQPRCALRGGGRGGGSEHRTVVRTDARCMRMGGSPAAFMGMGGDWDAVGDIRMGGRAGPTPMLPSPHPSQETIRSQP